LPLAANASDPKPSASHYPVHATAGKINLGAEFMVRSFQGQNQTFVTRDYLVVEVAVYPPKFDKIRVSHSQFSLCVNGKKELLSPENPGVVAASLKYRDWGQHPTLSAGGGLGGVVLGPRSTGRFPGDPTSQGPSTRVPRAPGSDNPGGVEEKEPVRADEVAIANALAEGESPTAVCGYLYFPYKKQAKSIRSLELIYRGPDGGVTLCLR
jgi:hypothetical protein